MISLLLLGILLVSPLVLAQEQAQTYSGFDRFIDNVKMFFSFGDKKVMLALDIREKELNSAIINTKNGDNEAATNNLQRARERLQFIQEKVSVDVAEDVKLSVDEIVGNIGTEENLPKNFEVYVLEEKKTQLTAELIIEVEGKEGQTEVKVVEEKLGKINNEIKAWVVENSVGKDGGGSDDGLTWEIKADVASGDYGGDDGLTPVVKTHVAGDGTIKNEPLPEPDLNKINPDLYDPNARAPGDTNRIDNPAVEEEIIPGVDSGIMDDVEGTVNVDSSNNVVDEGDNQIDQPPKDKDNEDVSPEPNVVDDTVDPGPEGIVGSG